MTARGFLGSGPSSSDLPASLAGFRLVGNIAQDNADLGFDVLGVTDGGSNRASGNGNSLQCVGVDCGGAGITSLMAAPAPVDSQAPVDGLRHEDR